MLVNKNFSDIVTFARASARWRFSSGGVLVQDAANVPSLDYDPITLAARGLLVEEPRTNAIRNSSMAGAAAGTPGTLPTNWTYTNATGLSTQIVGTGTVNGIPYVDIRIFGSSTAAAGFSVAPDFYTTQAASTGQSWTGSAFVALLGGSLTNVSGFNLYIQYGDSAQSTLESGTQALSAISAALTRYTKTVPSTVAGAAYVRSFINFSVASGVAVDLTLRIGAPQLELGAFVTSPILTTGAQATRAADSAAITDLTKLGFNPSEGTVYAEALVPAAVATAAAAGIVALHDGSISNRMVAYFSGGNARVLATIGGTAQSFSVGAAPAAGSVCKLAFAYRANDFAASMNGAAAVPWALSGVPSVSALRLGGTNQGASSEVLNSWLRNVRYYPRRMSNAELQSLTT